MQLPHLTILVSSMMKPFLQLFGFPPSIKNREASRGQKCYISLLEFNLWLQNGVRDVSLKAWCKIDCWKDKLFSPVLPTYLWHSNVKFELYKVLQKVPTFSLCFLIQVIFHNGLFKNSAEFFQIISYFCCYLPFAGLLPDNKHCGKQGLVTARNEFVTGWSFLLGSQLLVTGRYLFCIYQHNFLLWWIFGCHVYLQL